MGNHVRSFKESVIFRARAVIFELNQDGYITFIKFKYESHSPLIEGVFEKTNIECFCPHFGYLNRIAKVYLFCITN